MMITKLRSTHPTAKMSSRRRPDKVHRKIRPSLRGEDLNTVFAYSARQSIKFRVAGLSLHCEQPDLHGLPPTDFLI